MTLASPIFKAMLAPNGFIEGRILASSGKVEVPLPEDDAMALFVLLRIIHGQTQELSVAINIRLLTKVAVLVDKYNLQDAVGFFAKIWMDYLEESGASQYDNTEDWLCIAWVFRDERLFNRVAKIAVMHSEQTFGSILDDLPSPKNLVGTFFYTKSLVSDIDHW